MATAAQGQRLCLRAEDDEDLAVIAAMMQDSIIVVGELTFLPRARRFVGVLTRFCWDDPETRAGKRFACARCGFHFETVRAVRARGVRQDRPGETLTLLTLLSEPTGDGVRLHMIFSGGSEIEIDAECTDAHLSDLGQRWYTRERPRHLDGGRNG